MNEYKVTDISVSMKESFTRTIMAKRMRRFYEITEDENPLHVSEEKTMLRPRVFN